MNVGEKGISYDVENKILAKIARDADAPENHDKAFVLIIDEINRANLPSVLGELIYALEYRGEPVVSMYEYGNSGREIILPKNLYIIGTMNTADRSVGHIDYAIRRRFAFVDVQPNETIIENQKAKSLFKDVDSLFKEHLSPDFQKDDVMIGHSYFLVQDDNKLKIKLDYEIKPILKEYLKNKEYLFLGVDFSKDTFRMVANEITVDLKGGTTVLDSELTKKEDKFIKTHNLTNLNMSIDEFIKNYE